MTTNHGILNLHTLRVMGIEKTTTPRIREKIITETPRNIISIILNKREDAMTNVTPMIGITAKSPGTDNQMRHITDASHQISNT